MTVQADTYQVAAFMAVGHSLAAMFHALVEGGMTEDQAMVVLVTYVQTTFAPQRASE